MNSQVETLWCGALRCAEIEDGNASFCRSRVDEGLRTRPYEADVYARDDFASHPSDRL